MLRYVMLIASAVVILCAIVTPKTLQVPAQYPTIQSAINATKNRDTVLVETGTYREHIKFRGRSIVVASMYLIDQNPNTVLATIIDGSVRPTSDSNSVVLFTAGEDSTTQLVGFSLINGIGTQVQGSFRGGGIVVTGESSPVIRNNIIRNNSAVSGGGIAVIGANPTISNNAIVANSARHGGGVSLEYCKAKVIHNVFFQNIADNEGGAIFIGPSVVGVYQNSITDNRAVAGGGIYCEDGFWEISYCNFFRNEGGNFGGCLDPRLGDKTAAKNFNFDSADIFLNIFGEPLYVSPSDYNFSLNCNSRLIDAGEGVPLTYPVGGSRADIGMSEYPYRVGDVTGDGRLNVADITAMINIIFKSALLPCPIYATDTDCDRVLTIADAVCLIYYWMGVSQCGCLFDLE